MNTDKHRFLSAEFTKRICLSLANHFHRCASVFIGGKNRFALLVLLSVVTLSLVSCAEVAKDMGLDEVPDVEQRAGLTGTRDNPGMLDPFKTYNLVLAANECRYLSIKVPEHWYWKLYLTAANREATRSSHLEAEIEPATPAWDTLPASDMKKTYNLLHEGVQCILGIGNTNGSRYASLKICQEGAPVRVTLKSEVSSHTDLLGPNSKETK
jgi:hypothetical protein